MDIEEKDKNTKKRRKISTGMIIALCAAFALAYSVAIMFIMFSISGITVVVKNNGDNVKSSIAGEFQANKGNAVDEGNAQAQTQNPDTDLQASVTDEANGGTADTSDVVIDYVQTIDEDSATTLAVVTDVTEVVKVAMPSVVAITNEYTSYDSWYGYDDSESCASGIIIEQNEKELMIVTNYHVIADSNSLVIKFINDEEAQAYVKGTDEDEDLAVVSVALSDLSEDTINSIAIAVLGDSDALQVGEPAIAIGNSLGYGQSVTTGVISALNRNINDSYLIQTDAAINPGNSGGALLNIRGEVIGINSSKIADYVIEGMGYAIPISTAKPIIEKLVLNETKMKASENNRGFLGISGTDVTEDAQSRYGMPAGVYVVDVIDGGGAQKGGIKKGDVITTFDGEAVDSMTGLQGMLEYYEAGTVVDVGIMRQSNGEYNSSTITVTLGKKEE